VEGYATLRDNGRIFATTWILSDISSILRGDLFDAFRPFFSIFATSSAISSEYSRSAFIRNVSAKSLSRLFDSLLSLREL